MSSENAERWAASAERFRTGVSELDWQRWIEEEAAFWHPQIEWDASELGLPDIAARIQGREAVRRWWRQWLAAWQTLEFEFELVEAGDRVVMLVEQRMRGRSSGIEVPATYAMVATFQNRLMVHWKFYASQAEALEVTRLPN